MTNYARDEFDRVPEASARQGVHRAASAPARARLWPILTVGIGSLAVGVVAFLFLPQLGFQAAASPLSAMTAEAPPSSQPSASASGTATPSATAASPGATASGTPSASASGSAPAADSAGTEALSSSLLDKSQPVSVYNATLTSGLAGRVGATVQKDGWTLGQVSNWQGAPQQESVIFYSDAAQKANAEALGELLNITKLVETGDLQAPVAVVLGPEFQ
jgi:hypothetical protein